MHKILQRHSSPVFQLKFLHNLMPSIFDRFFLIDGRKKDDSPQSKAYRPMKNRTNKMKMKQEEINQHMNYVQGSGRSSPGFPVKHI